ncbi:helix-turn-helix transcriptional regulator [Streptomyces sp. NRRL WC-3742]|uniref:helix-turn-helix transcriptional regulator n=1 Tax=Streptomyces sp. NRRL WC-3742 TaxID=1463934 RepID=UPI0004C9D642|nr:helix-turn-helix transcriptional regulator [Streptomyces sp. NRRL WC-3742]
MLEVFGLDTDTEAVYREMLEGISGGVVELAVRVGATEATVRKALDRLVELNLLTPSREAVGGLRAVSLEAGLAHLLHRQEEELAKRHHDLAAGKAAAARAIAQYSALQPDTDVEGNERLLGLDAIQARLEILTRQLRSECLSIIPGGAQSEASLEASRPLDEQALNRMVRMRALYQESVRNDPPTLAYAQWTTERGGEVRTSPVLPTRLLIFDRATALVPIDPGNSRAGALCTTSPGIVATLVALFEQTWDAAAPLGAVRRGAAEEGISQGERELLKLLASGMTDEAAGKRLGVSMRTVRRQMAALMERLQATSRFEAGLKAAQRGWL